MLRQKRRIALHYPADAEPHLVNGGNWRTPGTLVVRVHPRELWARWAALTGGENPPVFRGHVDRGLDGFTVTGTIRETRAVALLPFAFLGVCAVGVMLTVLGISSDYNRAVSVAVGVPLAILFAVLLVLFLRRWRPRFRLQAGQLEHGLDTYVRTGDVRRAVR